jgi:hypothetical protein
MSKNKIKVLDRHFKNKLDRKQSNKKERQEGYIQTNKDIQRDYEDMKRNKMDIENPLD